MGQFYQAFNIDKQETVSPYECGTVRKLTELCYVGNRFGSTLNTLLATRWSGDRVILIGSYAWVDGMSGDASASDKLRHWEADGTLDCDPYQIENSAKRYVSNPRNYRFIVNQDKGVYIDREKMPVSRTYTDDYGIEHPVRQDAMYLFLAVGNGLGLGDYKATKGLEQVGSWAGDRITATDNRPEGLTEIASPFDPKA